MKVGNIIINKQDDGRYSFTFNGNFADFKIWSFQELKELKQAIDEVLFLEE